ncbi:hypothetical protein SUGI_0336420 [Cryptomeria japonica]|nr:hypothetical protein SUGI_0336420 [Cryptomeria japonica]
MSSLSENVAKCTRNTTVSYFLWIARIKIPAGKSFIAATPSVKKLKVDVCGSKKYGRDEWGGAFEIHGDAGTNDNRSRTELDGGTLSRQLDETQQSWLLGQDEKKKKKKKYVDLGCVVVSQQALKWILYSFALAAIVTALALIIAKTLPKHHHAQPPPDNYTLALHKALQFFNAQKSGVLPKANNVSWRGNSGLQDGISDPSVSAILPKVGHSFLLSTITSFKLENCFYNP